MPHHHHRTPTSAARVAIDIRTRSSRLFFVLLHLVGVSTNIPSTGGRRHSNNNSYSRSSSDSNTYGIFSIIREHIPSWLIWPVGIVGVHPTGILLEKLDVQSSRRGLMGILERVERVWKWDGNKDLLGEPYWFQDNIDGLCLGPNGGFSECGDSTLWRIKRRPLTKRQLREKRYKQMHRQREEERRQASGIPTQSSYTKAYKGEDTSSSVCVWPFFCEENSQVSQPTTDIGFDEIYGFEYENNDEEEEEEGFSLQLIGGATSSYNRIKGLKGRSHNRRFSQNTDIEHGDMDECLLSFPSAKNGDTALQIGSCSSEEAWVWHVNRDGILVRGSTKAEKRKRQRRWKISPRKASAAATVGGLQSSQSEFGCVHRTNSTLATLLPCSGDVKRRKANKGNSLVGFSLVRYPCTISKQSKTATQQQSSIDGDVEEDPSLTWEPWTTVEPASALVNGISQTDYEEAAPIPNLPHSQSSSQNHAAVGAKPKQSTVKSTTVMLHTSLEHGKAKKDAVTSASHIRDAPVAINGVAFHKQRMNAGGDNASEKNRSNKGPTKTKLRLEKTKKDVRKVHPSRGGSQPPIQGDASNPHRPRKIPVHPYILNSKDFVWVDPLTSLEYPTDLCDYLGHTKKEAGRHTLMGVGQYYRTAFNIKVYGAALYVAKRDVLADQKFGEEFATLSSDELRSREDFYDHLMSMPSPGENPAESTGGYFDRTLFIKINMQLSTDAMRKSLEADWSLLTDEMKATIINSSFEERMADERMQQKIQSKENSSNCSCGQKAPPELKADPSCCARGTELVFTWRKNSDFEVRLDGRLMDIFPRPDIARGIFAEYLNNNPISLDAKAHFADGFPFLLAPLAQVKGMSSAVPQTHESSTEKVIKIQTSNPMHRMMNAAVNSMGTMNNQAHSLSKWMSDSAAEMQANAMGVARELSEELDKQRMDFFENAVSLQKEGVDMLTSLMRMSVEEDGMALTIVSQDSAPTLSPFEASYDSVDAPREIIPDEIGIKIEPTGMDFSHSLFFTTFHIYLFLMFLMSIQGSARFVVKRRILETKRANASMSKMRKTVSWSQFQ